MEQTNKRKQDIQLDDIAAALQLSASTVSRAISGKGRVSSETRKRVQAFIEQHEYHPNSIAQSLAQSRTYNIGVVLPSDAFSSESPFFQNAMIGASLAAQARNYDVIVISVSENDLSSLRRLVVNKKVDGVLLTRSVDNDPCIALLKQAGLPFVLIGRTEDVSVTQVDADNTAACRTLTARLLGSGFQHPAYLYGNSAHIVNRSRLAGFLQGVADAGLRKSACRIVPDLTGREEIAAEVDALLAVDTDCIVCGDDYICSRVLSQLAERDVSVPTGMRVASFFDSVLLENNRPRIPAVSIDARALGTLAAEQLLLALSDGGATQPAAGLQNVYTIKDVEP